MDGWTEGRLTYFLVQRHLINSRAVRFQKFHPGSGFGFFGTKKPRFGSVSVIFKKEEQYQCMNSFMYVSSIFTK